MTTIHFDSRQVLLHLSDHMQLITAGVRESGQCSNQLIVEVVSGQERDSPLGLLGIDVSDSSNRFILLYKPVATFLMNRWGSEFIDPFQCNLLSYVSK